MHNSLVPVREDGGGCLGAGARKGGAVLQEGGCAGCWAGGMSAHGTFQVQTDGR